MKPTRWTPCALLVALIALPVMPALAAPFYTLSEQQAYRVADHLGEAAYENTAWPEGWWRECERQTPWTFSCSIELWSEAGSEPACRREFNVASNAFTGRLRTENWTRWECDPAP